MTAAKRTHNIVFRQKADSSSCCIGAAILSEQFNKLEMIARTYKKGELVGVYTEVGFVVLHYNKTLELLNRKC